MYIIYSLLFAAWVIVMLPFFFYNAVVNKKYLPSMGERMGKLPDTLKADGRFTIWLHSCSVGETLSLQPLARLLSENYPDARLVFSVITMTGRKIAEERYAQYGVGNTFYFPIDLPLFVNQVLNFVKPNIMISVDTEIWPNVVHQLRKRNIPVVLVNGKISAKSFQYYRWLQPLLAPVLSDYTALLMKDEDDAQRIQRMGASASRIKITGNIKYDRDSVEKDVSHAQQQSIAQALALSMTPDPNYPVIVAGSTHDNEEETLFTVLRTIRATPGHANTRILIAPRHPQRFDAVASLGVKMGFRVCRRSENKPDPAAEVLVLDTLGELAAAYAFATIVFVGGTMIPHGGQSIMEPALHSKAIVIGPHMENFPGVIKDFRREHALRAFKEDETNRPGQIAALTAAFTELLENKSERELLGRKARAIFDSSKGATRRTFEHLEAIISDIKR